MKRKTWRDLTDHSTLDMAIADIARSVRPAELERTMTRRDLDDNLRTYTAFEWSRAERGYTFSFEQLVENEHPRKANCILPTILYEERLVQKDGRVLYRSTARNQRELVHEVLQDIADIWQAPYVDETGPID